MNPVDKQAHIEFGFGQVRHRRLSPVVHAFAYAAWFVRLPLRALAAQGWQSGVKGLCVGQRSDRLGVWPDRFAVLHRDHGDGQQTLLAWIESLLLDAGVHDVDGEIWLQTFPRVLGYVFNPVSFWFCHRADGSLRAVLCEVNNTFGERHCYLLVDPMGAALKNGQVLCAQKVFHVSPFCKVDGHYRFRFVQTEGRVLARIELHDDHGPLLLTSISGDRVVASQQAVHKAFWRYPSMTFFVIARIHWQALKLFWKRVPFFRKPKPPESSVTSSSSF